ncbi:IS110 family transposase [Nitrogeniibacter mangrovi]|uniref:IS110 family transposase n=1 Tax=Nitrogeniibacter mangrovi TaxID=2016596 RepID=A0A6C1B871_9RHOO|nr:IS110 family transposase [Nitrogeniibacter mangrovi]QID19573.1 IS110 family transposase [Nitrogeniibacter mangrovi]
MNRSISQCFGVDVSKAELVIGDNTSERIVKIANRSEAIRGWLRRLPENCHIGMEATGTYHVALADLAHERGHRVYVLNPRSVAVYLKGLRSRGKTDILDARGITRFVERETDELEPYEPPTVLQRSIRTLLHRRHQVVKQRAAMRLSCQHLDVSVRATFTPLLNAFDQCLRNIDIKLRQMVRSDPTLHQLERNLRTIPGVGPLVGTALALRLSRHPYRNSDALVAALGMDPRPCQSGTSEGVRHLSKQGNGEERRLIYMAAVSACKTAHWRAKFENLLTRGNPTTAALCIIARKLLRIAFAINRSSEPYREELGVQTCSAS